MVSALDKEQETRPQHTAVLELKALVDAHLTARKLTDVWLYTRMGMSKGSYYDMWRRGSVRVDVQGDIAAAFDMPMWKLLQQPGSEEASSIASEPAATYQARPRYLEERVADLERELQALKSKLK